MAKMNILTVYYFGKEVNRVNHAVHANTAVPRCVYHMQLNHYEANVAEVFDAASGVLHAVVKRTFDGIKVVFKREVKEGM